MRAAPQDILRRCLLAVVWLAGGCGYHVAGTANGLPTSLHVLAVPPFDNHTLTPRISQTITVDVEREFLQRTHYRVQPESAGSDAVLHGSVTSATAIPVTFDPTSGRVSMIEVTLHLTASLDDAHSGKQLYRNDDMVFHEQYQVSQQVRDFFEEDRVAFERMSRTIARTLVAAILEQF